MDETSEIKLCGLCSKLVDESMEIKTPLKSFLDEFLNIPRLPSRICLECYQGASSSFSFKTQCLQTTEKMSKCKLATTMILGFTGPSPEPQRSDRYCTDSSKPQINDDQTGCNNTVSENVGNSSILDAMSPLNSQCSSQEGIINIESSPLQPVGKNINAAEKSEAVIRKAKYTGNVKLQPSCSQTSHEAPLVEDVVPVSKRLRSRDSFSSSTSAATKTHVTKNSTNPVQIPTPINSTIKNEKHSKLNVAFNEASSKTNSSGKKFPATPFKKNQPAECRMTRSGTKFSRYGKQNNVLMGQDTPKSAKLATTVKNKSAPTPAVGLRSGGAQSGSEKEVVEPQGCNELVKSRNSSTIDKEKNQSTIKFPNKITPKESTKTVPKRKKPSLSPKASSSSRISPRSAKVINAKKWVGRKGGSWKVMIQDTSKSTKLGKSINNKSALTPVGCRSGGARSGNEKEVVVEPQGCNEPVKSRNSSTADKKKDQSAIKFPNKITSKEPVKTGTKRKKLSMSPKTSNSSRLSPPAKIIKAEKWVGPKRGSWKGWALVEIDGPDSKNVIQQTSQNIKRTSRGRAIRARKLSEYDFNESEEKMNDELSEKFGDLSDSGDKEWNRKEKTDDEEAEMGQKPIVKSKSAKKLQPGVKRESLHQGSPLPEEIGIVSENDLNLANEEESFPPNGPYQCEICQIITETKFEFVSHIKQFHPDVVDEEVMSSLERDLLIQSKRVLLEEHIKNSAKKEAHKPKQENTKLTSGGKRICNICGTSINNSANALRKHQNTEKCKKAAMKKCQYCNAIVQDNESIDNHQQSDSCLTARYLLDRSEGNNAAKMISNESVENNELNQEYVPGTSPYIMPEMLYENSQTIHPQYQYDELLGVTSYNGSNNDNMITLYNEESSTAITFDVQNGRDPVVSTVADSTTVASGNFTKISSPQPANDALTNLVNDTVSSISMPIIDTSPTINNSISITRVDKIASTDMIENKGDNQESVLQPAIYNIPSSGLNNYSNCINILSGCIEGTVTSSQHQTTELYSTNDSEKTNELFSFGKSDVPTSFDFPSFDQLDEVNGCIKENGNHEGTAIHMNEEEYDDMLNTPIMDDMMNTPIMDDMINTSLMMDEHLVEDDAIPMVASEITITDNSTEDVNCNGSEPKGAEHHLSNVVDCDAGDYKIEKLSQKKESCSPIYAVSSNDGQNETFGIVSSDIISSIE